MCYGGSREACSHYKKKRMFAGPPDFLEIIQTRYKKREMLEIRERMIWENAIKSTGPQDPPDSI